MDIQKNDIIQLWEVLGKYSVRYIMIGGFAVNFHGHNRFTDDIDVWLFDSVENREKFGTALEEIGVGSKEIIQRMQFVPGWSMMHLRMGFPLDVMTKVKGLDKMSFEKYYEMAIKANIKGTIVPFLHINHLLDSKISANRRKDLDDIEALEIIKKEDEQS